MDLIVKYGPEVGLVCLVAIFLVGCIKVLFKKQFDKVEKGSRKTVYETLSIVLAFGLTALWMFLKGKYWGGDAFNWQVFGAQGGVTYSAVKVGYSLYENFKLRDLFQVIGRACVSIFAKKDTKKTDTKEAEDNEKHVNVI